MFHLSDVDTMVPSKLMPPYTPLARLNETRSATRSGCAPEVPLQPGHVGVVREVRKRQRRGGHERALIGLRACPGCEHHDRQGYGDHRTDPTSQRVLHGNSPFAMRNACGARMVTARRMA